jgi:two-component system sensor histidine kinase KdpD
LLFAIQLIAPAGSSTAEHSTQILMDVDHPNPDAILASLKQEEIRSRRGMLKVFIGMAPGVGKTYAMLEAARRELTSGRDVMIGYVETHGRKETAVLAQGLPQIPRLQVEYRGVLLSEFDLDAVLARRPQVVLVDELAHTNVPSMRHPKRFQDVMELLDAGINVLTTLNVQHVESRADAVRQITGIPVRETVPDSAVEGAEFELVDLAPEELRKRLAEGKVYVPESARSAQDNFFRTGNLAALRELALRFVAEQVGQDVLAYRQAHNIRDPWKTGQRLLVAVSPSPTSASLVRWTRLLAGELQAGWLAVYVELPSPLNQQAQSVLSRNLALVRELGGQVVTTSDSDIVLGILRVAREQNATQIVVGKPAGWHALQLMRGGSLLNRLIRSSGNIDIHAVRADEEQHSMRAPIAPSWKSCRPRSYAVALGVVAAVTGVNALLQRSFGYQSLALFYLLSVVGLGMFVGRGPTLLAASVTALIWNLLFVPPVFTLRINGATDLMLFCTYFVVALAMGHLAARLRAQQEAERHREQRATSLYLFTRELVQASDFADLLAIIVREVGKAMKARVALSLPGDGADTVLTPYFASTWELTEKEQSVASWAFSRGQPCGPGTDTLPSAEGLHLPLVAGQRVLGVLSLRCSDQEPLSTHRRDLLQAFVNQIGLVLDRQRLRDAEQEAKLTSESERLSKTLLNSVSHEIRTPIAAITAAASTLGGMECNSGLHKSMVNEIQEAAGRLNRLVGNLLSMTRLEAGRVQPKLDWCDVADLIRSTVKELQRELAGREVKIDLEPSLPLVKMDFVLTQQSLNNLLLNAAIHTPGQTPIDVRAFAREGELVLSVADRGPGLPPEALPYVFNKFYRAPAAATGGTGLGLAIVKGFVESQGGKVHAENRSGGGVMFSISLPLMKAPTIAAEIAK